MGAMSTQPGAVATPQTSSAQQHESAKAAPQPETPHVAFTCTGADGTVIAGRDQTRPFYAASTMKVAVLLAALRQVAAGELSLDTTLVATSTFTGYGQQFTLDGDHLDEQFPAAGTPLTLREVLDPMITRSTNEATNLAMQLVGIEAIGQVVTDLNLVATKVQRLIGDSDGREAGRTNEVCSQDLTTLSRAVLTDLLGIGTELTSFATGLLQGQQLPIIGAVLPEGTRWGSKSGWIDGIRHDLAFIGDPGRELHLAVCTDGIDQATADQVIGALTEALVLPRL